MSFVVAYVSVNRPALATTTSGPISHCVEDLGRPIAPDGRLEAALRRAWDWISGVR
jgi:hypothetical protein